MDLDKVTILGIYGDRNSGKSNLAVHILRQYKGKRKIYILGYPKPIDKFETMTNRTKIIQVKNSIIFIDEFTSVFPVSGHTNKAFNEIARKLRHYNNTLIFTTQQTQDLTKSMEGFVDGFCITRISNLKSLKNGSKIKDILDDMVDFRKTPFNFNLEPGQYYEFADCHIAGEDKVSEFPFQNIGKDWANISEKHFASHFASDFASDFAPEFASELAHKTDVDVVKPNVDFVDVVKPKVIRKVTLQEIDKELNKKEEKGNAKERRNM